MYFLLDKACILYYYYYSLIKLILTFNIGFKMDNLNDSKYKVFKDMKPTFFKSLQGISFYECPINGDEEGLIAVLPDKSLKVTELFDLPTSEEVKDMLDYQYFDLLPEWQGNW